MMVRGNREIPNITGKLGRASAILTTQIVDRYQQRFKDLVQETFGKITQRISFAKQWCEKFLDFQKLS